MNGRNLRKLRQITGDQRGATAAEFAMVIAPMILLILGTINLGLMMYTVSTLHFAVESTARWASIVATTTGTAPTSAAIQAHAAAVYKGPTTSATFVQDGAAACGNTIKGTTNYNFTTGVTTTAIPLSATACYPLG